MTINALKSMVDLLRADTVVAAMVDSVTIHGRTFPAITGEIDDEWAKFMPGNVVLVREAGGLAKTGVGPLSWPRFDVRCYGKDPGGVWAASELSRIIFERLLGLHQVVGERIPMVEGLMAITLNAGPTPGREPDTGWAYNLRTYDVLQGG